MFNWWRLMSRRQASRSLYAACAELFTAIHCAGAKVVAGNDLGTAHAYRVLHAQACECLLVREKKSVPDESRRSVDAGLWEQTRTSTPSWRRLSRPP